MNMMGKLLTISAALLVSGTVLGAIGNAMGARSIYYQDGKLSVGENMGVAVSSYLMDESDESAELNLPDQMEVEELELDIGLGELEVIPGKEWSVKGAHLTQPKQLEYSLYNGELKVRYGIKKNKISGKQFRDKVVVTIPTDCSLRSVVLNSGVGDVTLRGVKAEKLKLNGGVGDITAQEIQILNNLEVDSGVGDIDLDGVFRGEVELNGGVGNLQMTLRQVSEQDYDFDVESGVGNIQIGEKDLSLFSGEYEANQGKENQISVDGGVGEIQIRFVP